MNDSIEWEQSVWAVAPRDVISAVGVDTERYLHSQLSQQIEGLSDGDRVLSLLLEPCLLYTSPSPRDVEESRMPSSA